MTKWIWKWAKPQGTAQTAVIMQHSGIRGGWKSATPGLAHVHTAADDPTAAEGKQRVSTRTEFALRLRLHHLGR